MTGQPHVSWSVVRYCEPLPSDDPWFRGGPHVLAVPGDTLLVVTPDGVLKGEPADGELLTSAFAFLLLTGEALFHVDRERVEELLLDDLEPERTT
jgi:hypothetical protein